METNQIEIIKTVRFKGVCAVAKKLGISSQHLTYILHGERKPGKDLAIRMKELGITIPKN